jgi:murein peptide amidase A
MMVESKKRSFVVLALLACWSISLAGCDCGLQTSHGKAELKPMAYRTVTVGQSVDGKPIRMHIFGDSGPTTFIFGGIHGDESISEFVALSMIEHLLSDGSSYESATVAVLPSANPDGLLAGTRVNANAVDCNRNFPAVNWKPQAKGARYSPGKSPGSEPETRALIKAIEMLKPDAIVSIHSTDTFKPCNNYDGPAEGLAKIMAPLNGYPAKGSVGYPTPGSFGTWAGVERKIPTITLELPNKARPQKAWPPNRDALLALIAAAGNTPK